MFNYRKIFVPYGAITTYEALLMDKYFAEVREHLFVFL